MGNLVSKTLVRHARKHLKSTFIESCTVVRTGIVVPISVVVLRTPDPLKGVHERQRLRKWRLLMPDGTDPVWENTDVNVGDRILTPGHGTFLVTETTDPNTYNVATNVWALLSNAVVTFRRPTDAAAVVGPVDVYIGRVTDEQKSYGIAYDWDVWFDGSLRYPGGTQGGVLISKGDEMNWARSPNPAPKRGNVILDAPHYTYGDNGTAVAEAFFKEVL